MSKTPLISLNDGTSWADAVPKLRTDELGASTTDWVQEDDTKAASLKVTANGEYPAASAGKYGYDYVTVSVKGGSATGIGPDGNEHTVTPDPETGKLIDEVIPSSIIVTTPPTVTTYQDGDTIDFTGIVVTAYTLDGEVWEDSSHPGGVIPVSELEFPVTTAVYDPDAAPYDGSATLNGTTVQYNRYGGSEEYIQGLRYETAINVNGSMYLVKDEYGYPCAFFTDANASLYGTEWEYLGPSLLHTYTSEINASNASTSVTDGGVAYYYKIIADGANSFTVSNNLIPKAADGLSRVDIANILFDGVRVDGKPQDIPVNWQRPGDGAILETTFPINVTPAET